jgi:HAD superfamily hydrolase (TIGR01509 family)
MKLYHYISISFILIVACTIASSLARATKNKPTRSKKSNAITLNDKKYTIFVDLTNVLIKENQIGFAKEIGYGVLASYAITHWKSPGYRCLDMLAAMSNHETQKPHITITLNNRVMPRCLVELQEGKKTCAQAKTEIKQGIEHLDTEKFFSSTKEKTLMTDIMNLILDPTTVSTMIEPVKGTVQLVEKLKAAGHTVLLVGNTPGELYAIAESMFPDIIKLFDGVVISSQVNMVKPDVAIYNHVIAAHNLDPAHCIVIEDLEASAAAARTLGMQAIVFDKPSHVIKKLKNYGIRI